MCPLVSVIVPVYKVENYLERCLDSLCRQRLCSIEVILVDDASPDRSGEICEEYAKRDNRFRVFHHLFNRGLAAARNTGIRLAMADYLMFVDSDDYVHEDFCRIPYECAVQKQADLVMFRYQSVGKNGLMIDRDDKLDNFSGYKTRVEAMDLVLFGSANFAAWNKLYHKKLFDTISFPEGYVCEDVGTTYRIIWQACYIYFLNQVLYSYCYRDESITGLKSNRFIQDMYEMYMRQYQDLAVWGYPAKKLELFYSNISMSYCIQHGVCKTNSMSVLFTTILKQCKSIPQEFTWKRKILFVLFKYSLPLFNFVCCLWCRRI